MNSNQNAKLSRFTDELIAEADALARTKQQGEFKDWVDHAGFFKWLAGCRHLFQMIGNQADVWIKLFDGAPGSTHNEFLALQGSLLQFKGVLDAGLLCKVEDLVIADTFGNLLEQADDLVKAGYDLAAGVLCRAVLEEHLRNLCTRHGCVPTAGHTINSFKTALYADSHLDKLAMKQVEYLADAGNRCAHNVQPPLSKTDIERLIRDVTDFVARHPLP